MLHLLRRLRPARALRILQHIHAEEEGANLVIMALLLTALLGFAGLAIDGSNVYFQQQRMQIAADAAALGGARQLALNATLEEVDAEICDLAVANYADPCPRGTLWKLINNDRGVHVLASRTFASYFAKLFGINTFTVKAQAEAQYEPVTGTDNLFPLTLDCDCLDEDQPVDNGKGTSVDEVEPGEPTPTPTPEPGCELYPIALHTQSLIGITPGQSVGDIFNGVQPGNFGWLSWDESNNVPALTASLTPPGNSDIYINPFDPKDNLVSAGDWVSGLPGVDNSDSVRFALEGLRGKDITVPVWDDSMRSGSNALYRVASFAKVRITDYHLPSENRITATFLGYSDCRGNTSSSGTLTLSDDSQSEYEISFLSHVGNIWTYQVRKINGGDIGSWNLGIDACVEKVVGATQGGVVNGETDFKSIQWPVSSGFTIGTFAFELNGDYPAGTVQAQVTAGELHGTTPIRGPVCDGTDGSGDPGGTPANGICLPVLDFEADDAGASLVAGQVVDSEWSSWGVHVTTYSPTNHPAMIFDSASPTGNDPDLGSSHQAFGGPGRGVGGGDGMPGRNSVPLGKVLIAAETNNPANPDDAAAGGEMVLTFDLPVRIDEVHVLDIDDNSAAGTVKAYSDPGGNTLVATGRMLGLGDNSFQIVPVDASNVRRLEISLPKGGAVPAIVSCRSQQAGRYRIGSLIWSDANGNGLQDSGESGIAGVDLALYAAGNDYVIATTTTNHGGAYTFDNLPAGDYEVEIAAGNFASGGVLAGALYAASNAGADDKDSDFNSGTGRAPATVPLNGGDNLTVGGGFNLAAAATPVEAGPTSGTVSLNDNTNSTYMISLTGHTGNTWTYKVEELSGRSLSHWNLGIESCLEHIVAYTPATGYAAGVDGSTGFNGIKWDVAESFTSGEFSFTLDADYPEGTAEALAKASNKSATIDILAPDCTDAVAPEDPGDGSGSGDDESGGDGGEGAPVCSFGWLDWRGGHGYQELKRNMEDVSRSGKWKIGDEVPPGPSLSASILALSALDARLGQTIKIPLSEYNGRGYAICGFIEVRLTDYDFSTGDRWLSVEYLKSLIRGDSNPTATDYGGRDVRVLK